MLQLAMALISESRPLALPITKRSRLEPRLFRRLAKPREVRLSPSSVRMISNSLVLIEERID